MAFSGRKRCSFVDVKSNRGRELQIAIGSEHDPELVELS